MISLSSIQKTYFNKKIKETVLDIKSLTIEESSFLAVVGPSGSGKSTLLNILGSLEVPSHGKYLYKDKDVFKFNRKQLSQFRNKEVGILLQFFALIPEETIYENIKLPLNYTKKTKKEKNFLIETIADEMNVSHLLGRYPNELSGGEQQRVALCRASINKPKLILADEPTGNLDQKNTEIIMNHLKNMNKKGHTICMVTHNMDLLKYCSDVINLKDGIIV